MLIDKALGGAIKASAFKEIEAEEFSIGNDDLSLWLVPEGFVYNDNSESFVQEDEDTTSMLLRLEETMLIDKAQAAAIKASAFKEIEAEEFSVGNDDLSLWLVPEGFLYNDNSESFVQEVSALSMPWPKPLPL